MKTGEGLSCMCKFYWNKTQTACVDSSYRPESRESKKVLSPTSEHRNHGKSQEFIYHGMTESKTNYCKISEK